jgi:integrase
MRPPLLLTTSAIRRLELEPGENDAWIWDADSGQHSGLGLRLRRGKTGTSRTFYASYRFAGQDRRDRLGDIADYSLADARHRVYELRRTAADGADPRAAKAATIASAVKASACPPFAAYAEHYLARRLKDLRPATYRDRERYLTGPHTAPFKALRLDQISKAVIAARLNYLEDTGIAKASAHVAQAVRMTLLDLFRLAVAEGLIEANPVTGTRQPSPPKQLQPRERALDAGELASLWNATSGAGDYAAIVRLAILLGGRRQELGGMRWSEIDAAGNWTLPASRSKTDTALTLPLPPAAIEILAGLERRPGRDRIFGGRSADGFTAWSHAKRELDAALPLAPWRLHDLRRTLITGLHDIGVEPHIVRAVAGHSQGADVHTRHYNRATYATQKAEALRRWADHVLAITNVTALPKAA